MVVVPGRTRRWRSKGILVDELNRDLLVAVLAVLTDAIPRTGLAAVLKSWSENREQPLLEVLKAATGLDDERFRALECLAAAHLKTHQDDLRLCLQALGAQELTDERADRDRTTGEDRRWRARRPGASRPFRWTRRFTGGRTWVSRLSRSCVPRLPPVRRTSGFKLIRPHAQGGIGQVWLAHDSELQRDVAVKEIQPRFAERRRPASAVRAGGGDHRQPGTPRNRAGV